MKILMEDEVEITQRSLVGGCLRLVLLALIVLQSLSSVHAQTFYGTLVGTVTDSSGAVIPGATVVVSNIATNEKRTTQSDAEGNYRFVNLVPDSYQIEVQKTNFKRYVRQSIAVQVDATVRVDASLAVGAVTETVEVTTQAPLLQTDSGTLKTEIEGTRVQEMPLNGRNSMNLIALAPGVVPQGSSMGSTSLNQHGTNTNQQGWGNYQIGGAIAGQGAEYLDGAPLNTFGGGLGSAGGTMALVPTQDAVQEFTVATNAVTADFGRFGGGVVNMTTKSGGNQFHGSVYEYFRNTVLNSNDYYTKASELLQGTTNKPPQWNQNQYGVVVSGPIRKNKAFFLLSWEEFKSRTGSAAPTNVPTSGMQDGTQIPEVYNSQGKLSNANVHDPLGNCAITHTVGTAANPGYYTIPFGAGNCVMDSTAAIMKGYYLPPTPNFTNSAGNNYFIDASVGDNQYQYNSRIDYTVSDRQRIFGRYTYWNIGDVPLKEFPGNTRFNLGNAGAVMSTHQVVLGDTYTFNPNTILDVRVDYLRYKADGLVPNMNVDESQFGSAFNALSPQEAAHIYPSLSLSGSHNLYSVSSGFSLALNETYAVTGNLTRIVGRHSFKLGAEARLMNISTLGNSSSGSFSFSGQFTGDEWVDFLLGYTASGSINVGIWTTGYNYYQGYYLQDTWQAGRNLTINGGLRWELPGGILEKNDKNTVLLPNAVDPYTHVTGTLALVNSPLWQSRSSMEERYSMFAPNVGFAYRVGSNMSVRGGYGFSYLPVDVGAANPSGSILTSASTAYSVQGATPNTNYLLKNGFSNLNVGNGPGVLNRPLGRSNPAFMTSYVPAVPPGSQQSISGNVPTDPYGYMQQWNLSVSRQMKGDWMVEASYAGAKGTHLPALSGALDQLSDAVASTYTSAQLETSGTTIVTPSGVSQTVKYGQSLRPYPFYTGVTDSSPHWGDTHYHALLLRAEKRFRSGGVLTAAYTWSKMIGDADVLTGSLETKASITTRTSGIGSLQDNYNHRAERSIISYNTPQRAVLSYVLRLPFGQGQRWFPSGNAVTSRLVSGWTVNGITSLQSGYPLGIQESLHNNWSDFGAGTIRPNYIPGCAKKISGSAYTRAQSGHTWFNTSCFVAPTVGSTGANAAGYLAFGDEPRVDGTLTSDGLANWDVSLLKATKVSDRSELQFRAEFFNVFNRVQFAPPGIQDNASGFGAIQAQGNQPRLIQFSARLAF